MMMMMMIMIITMTIIIIMITITIIKWSKVSSSSCINIIIIITKWYNLKFVHCQPFGSYRTFVSLV